MSRVFSAWLLSLSVLALASSAQARNTSAYFGVDPGYQWYDTTELIIDKDPGTAQADWTPPAGFMPRLRLGFNVSGYGGAEAFIAGHWWGSGDQLGGGGVAGGVLRWNPLEALQKLWAPLKNRPVDLGLSFGAGYTLVGEDFAYQGWFLQYGFDLQLYVLPFLAIGFELPIRQMLYQPFRYTNFSGGKRGLCTQGGSAFGKSGREVDRTAVREVKNSTDGSNIGAIGVDPNTGHITSNYILDEKDGSEASSCEGVAPSAWMYSPMFTITFLVDFGV